MSPTSWLLLSVLLLLVVWEAGALLLGRLDLTITDTVRSWGSGPALALVLAAALLFWHLYAGPLCRR